MHNRNTFLAIASAAIFVACSAERPATDADPAANATAATTMTSPAETATDTAGSAATGDSSYLTAAVAQAMGQIELAQAAAKGSESAAVQTLAREIIAGNNQLDADLARIARKLGITLPSEPAPQLREAIARIEPFTGRNLDAAYLAAVLQTYPELVRLHEQAATTAADMELKSIAVRGQALLESHLRRAREVYTEVAGVPPPVAAEPGSPPPASATSGTL